MSIEAMKLAILTLAWANEEINGWMDDAYGHDSIDHPEIMSAITALSQAIEQAQKQDSVSWIYEDELSEGYPYDAMFEKSRVIDGVRMFPVNVAPQRQPLTDEQIQECWLQQSPQGLMSGGIDFARAIEAAHGIKGEA